jgi:hypothetical protein
MLTEAEIYIKNFVRRGNKLLEDFQFSEASSVYRSVESNGSTTSFELIRARFVSSAPYQHTSLLGRLSAAFLHLAIRGSNYDKAIIRRADPFSGTVDPGPFYVCAGAKQ